MTTLYNCKHSGDQYRITKFVDNEPEGSYLTTFDDCDCPAGVRPTCRHRQMLPKFISRGAVDTGWWFDFDRGGWVDMRQDWEQDKAETSLLQPHSTTVNATDFESVNAGSNPAGVATAPARKKPNDGRRV